MELLRPSSPDEATAALGNGSVALAGGTELVPLLRDGLVRADKLVQIAAAVPRGIEGTTIGAGTKLRSMGTVGGNLLQATRCWYWRLGFDCWLHGGEHCLARAGAHREHAIFGNELCASAHPSDIGAALLALGATVRTTQRELPVRDLYRLPTPEDRSTTTLAPDELILELDVPAPNASTYLKAMDRRKWAFPIVGVAAARGSGGIRIGLAGVAPIPWTLDGTAALDGATPLPGTAYKVEIARALVRRALEGVAEPSPT